MHTAIRAVDNRVLITCDALLDNRQHNATKLYPIYIATLLHSFQPPFKNTNGYICFIKPKRHFTFVAPVFINKYSFRTTIYRKQQQQGDEISNKS